MFAISIILMAVLIAIDQAVKIWAQAQLISNQIEVISGVFELTYVENRGAAFSVLQNKIWLFIVLTVIVLALIAYAFYKKKIYTNLGKISLILVSTGAIGNFIDRIWHGYVIDMFYFKLINFPVFNVADICITCGCVLFVIYMMFQHDKYAEEKKED